MSMETTGKRWLTFSLLPGKANERRPLTGLGIRRITDVTCPFVAAHTVYTQHAVRSNERAVIVTWSLCFLSRHNCKNDRSINCPTATSSRVSTTTFIIHQQLFKKTMCSEHIADTVLERADEANAADVWLLVCNVMLRRYCDASKWNY